MHFPREAIPLNRKSWLKNLVTSQEAFILPIYLPACILLLLEDRIGNLGRIRIQTDHFYKRMMGSHYPSQPQPKAKAIITTVRLLSRGEYGPLDRVRTVVNNAGPTTGGSGGGEGTPAAAATNTCQPPHTCTSIANASAHRAPAASPAPGAPPLAVEQSLLARDQQHQSLSAQGCRSKAGFRSSPGRPDRALTREAIGHLQAAPDSDLPLGFIPMASPNAHTSVPFSIRMHYNCYMLLLFFPFTYPLTTHNLSGL